MMNNINTNFQIKCNKAREAEAYNNRRATSNDVTVKNGNWYKKAASLIRNGKLVIFPTETVYGIGADASNQQACLNIFKAKGRPAHNPLIVHVDSVEKAETIAVFNQMAHKISKLWPGPISVVLPLKNNHNIADAVTAGLSTIAIRIPAHTAAIELIKQSGKIIAAPSANISGKLSSTTQAQVQEYFDDEIYILSDQSECEVGLESTIIDLTTPQPTILRHGFFTKEFLQEFLGCEILVSNKESKIKAPGMLLKHYSPKTKLRLNAASLQQGEVGLNFANSQLDAKDSLNLSKAGNLIEAAANLYKYLHKLDDLAARKNYQIIAVAPIPDDNLGYAINDRLKRAAEE